MKDRLRIFILLILVCLNQYEATANTRLNFANENLLNTIVSTNKAIGTPNAPTSITASPINTGGIIQFTAPSNDGGSSITNYEYSTDNGNTWITPSPAITSSPLIISSGLVNCTSYEIKLRAVNANGSGTASAPIALTPAISIDPGTTWTTRTSAADNNWFSVTHGNGLFVAVAYTGTGNRVMTSPDGINWTSRAPAVDNNWYSVAYGNGLFVAVSVNGTGNRVMTSPDGTTWTSRTSAADNSWFAVTYGNGLFVAVSTNGTGNQVMTSPDGITWTTRSTPTANRNWRAVTYGNGLFVAVAFGGGSTDQVITSTDGITWISRNSAVDNNWKSVTYGNGLFVAVANNIASTPSVMTSPDGISWTSGTSAAQNGWLSVTYGNSLFVAVSNTVSGLGSSNQVMTSQDGINWTSRTSAIYNSWTSVTYGNGIFVAVALDGAGNTRVMTSSFSPVADAPAINATTVSGTSGTVSFTQSLPADAPAITNYQYSTDNGANWTILSPVSTTSPITISGITASNNQIKLQAINSVGNSCPGYYSVVYGLNKYGQQIPTSSDFVNKNGVLGLSGILLTGESMDLPAVDVTSPVSNISSTTAISGGNVTSNKGSFVTARGVCWSLTSMPTTADNKTIDGNGTGTFTSRISGLVSNTTYYVRSYATNSVGTTYGQEVSFTTL